MNISEILTHLGEERSNYYNSICPPIIQSANFAFNTLDEFRNALADEINNHIYTRGNNPTVNILRKKVAALEGAEDALIFGSGSAAVASAIIACVQAGDHIISIERPYSWTNSLLTKFLPRFGVETTFVDGTKTENIEAAIQANTKLLFLESPNSLTFELQDLRACAELAKKHDIITCIDNSYASPLFQRPIDFGIDLVVHAGTKYLNGHSDIMSGVVCGSNALISQIFSSEYMTLGSVISPHDAALMLRGMRTLPLRMQRSHESALKIVAYLEQHPKVAQVLYPFSTSFPQYELAKRQMKGAGGLFSIHLNVDTIEQAETFFHALQHFLLAVSWGGYESLVLPSAAFYKIPGREDSPVPFTLVRFYVGLEDPDWLIADLEQALSLIK